MRVFQEELIQLNSRIVGVTSIQELPLEQEPRRLEPVRQLRSASSPLVPTERFLQSTPIQSRPSMCPMIKVDFTNFPNPMARWYGQTSMLKGGDYLFDQLWSSHGIRVSAVIRDNWNRWDYNIFRPKWDRGTRRWIDKKPTQLFTNHTVVLVGLCGSSTLCVPDTIVTRATTNHFVPMNQVMVIGMILVHRTIAVPVEVLVGTITGVESLSIEEE